ncbi:hypothetical protein RND81_03G047600 [Saponaria officinalis]|uniref:Aminotransferase-like plant mobile domain-containing protein n=1 Tax=Saponaria officinalis TaxID=3572 RepID=A0AAW1M5I4_SAPOF
MDKRGDKDKNWPNVHAHYIAMWGQRANSRTVGVPNEDDVVDYSDEYMVWYRQRTRLLINPFRRQQSASFQPTAAPLTALAQFVAKWNAKFSAEVRSMPREVPPHYRALLTDYGTESSHCLQDTGFQHLLQPLQNLDIGEEEDDLQEDSPLSDFTRRVQQRRSFNLSPVPENETPEDTPQSSRGRRQPNRKGKKKRT